MRGSSAAGGTAQQVFLPAPDGAYGPQHTLPPSADASTWQPPAEGGWLHSSQQPRMGPARTVHASVSPVPASAASAAASLTLQPAWAGVRDPGVPQHASTSAERRVALFEQFTYPSLLPELQQDQSPTYMHQYSLHSQEAQPTLLPPVRLSIGQQGAVFLPPTHLSTATADPASEGATGALRSPSGSADQRQALRGAALRQALQGSSSFPSRSPGSGQAQAAEQQQAGGATVSRNGHGPAEEHWQVVQLQPPSAKAIQQQQQPPHEQQQEYLLDQRRPSPNGIVHNQQPQLQPVLLPKGGDSSRRLPNPKQQQTQSSTSGGAGLAGMPVSRVDPTASNGALRGTLRSPSSPAKRSPDLPGLEALRRKLRTSSDRRARIASCCSTCWSDSCPPPASRLAFSDHPVSSMLCDTTDTPACVPLRSALVFVLKAGTPPTTRRKDINVIHAQLPSIGCDAPTSTE